MFMFTHLDQRLLKYVIRGLPVEFQIEKLKEELHKQNIEYNHSSQMRSLKGNHCLLPLFFVTNKNDETLKQKLTFMLYIGNYQIYVEAHKTKGFKQCYNCQRFNHSSLNCSLTPRCLKCGEEHKLKDCTKSSDLPAKCCNCGSDHPTNFSLCPANPQMSKLNRSQNNKPMPVKKSSLAPPLEANPIATQGNNNFTYATVTSKFVTVSPTTQATNVIVDMVFNLNSLMNILNNPLIQTLMKLLPEITKILTSQEDNVNKLFKLLTLVSKVNSTQ